MRAHRKRLFSLYVLLMLSLAGCAKDPLKVDTIQLGRDINPDGSVAGHTTTFRPGDTIYVSALNSASGEGTVSVRWTYAGRVIDEPSKEVSYNGPAATSFNLVNVGGFPVGNYKVEVFVNGEAVGERDFRVE